MCFVLLIPPLTSSSPEPKQSPWVTERDGVGRLFYHNTLTKETTWERPNDFVSFADSLNSRYNVRFVALFVFEDDIALELISLFINKHTNY